MKKLLILCLLVVIITSCINEPPVAMFSVKNADVYLTQEIEFINESAEADTYIWDFGDKTFTYEISPNHSYNKPGTYAVTLFAHGKGDDSYTTNINVMEATSSYQIQNNSSYGLYFLSLYYNREENIFEDETQLGFLTTGGKSDKYFTNRDELVLVCGTESNTFFIAEPFFIKKFKNNVFIMTDQTAVY